MVKKDLKKTKESMHLAQAAFFDRDPKAISLLQLSDEDEPEGRSGDSTDDEIYLFERAASDENDQQDAEDLDEVIQLREAQAEQDEQDDSQIES